MPATDTGKWKPDAAGKPLGVVVDVVAAAQEQVALEAVLGADVEPLGVVRRVRELERADQLLVGGLDTASPTFRPGRSRESAPRAR